MAIKRIHTVNGELRFEYEYKGQPFTIIKHDFTCFEILMDDVSYSVEKSLENCFKAIDTYLEICEVMEELLEDEDEEEEEEEAGYEPPVFHVRDYVEAQYFSDGF